MLIIVEGSNKVGKTTFISKLKKMYNVSSIHNRAILGEMKCQKQESIVSALSMIDVIKSLNAKENIILDRFHLSEYVYGKLFRGYTNVEIFSKVDKELSLLNCLLILVTSDYKHLCECTTAEDIDKYMQIQNQFMLAYKCSSISDKIIMKLGDIQ